MSEKTNNKSVTVSSSASKDLVQFVKECFDGNHEVRFFISERGNQRIEIQDLDNKEIWQTLEAMQPVDDMTNYDEIASHILMAMM